MVRVLCWLCLLLAMMLSGTCSALEIRRVAACSGVVLRLRGDFKDGDYARFKSQFGKRDTIVGLDLSSDGGDLEDGMQIATLTRQKKLSVYVADECNSVCAFVFFAAAKRYLAHNSKIGVHSVSNYRAIEDLSSMRLTLKMARLSAKLGTPISVIGKFVTTTPANMPLPAGAHAPTWNGGFVESHYYVSPQFVLTGRYEIVRMSQQALDSNPGNLGNIDAYSFGYRWYPFMYSRAGLAFHNEYSMARGRGIVPLSGDGAGAPFSLASGVWSRSLLIGFDFDF